MWATEYINKLKLGETVKFRPEGNSMLPIIRSGELCTLAPIHNRVLKINDVVLCQVDQKQYLHLIANIIDNQFQISNASRHINGCISREDIFGILINIEE